MGKSKYTKSLLSSDLYHATITTLKLDKENFGICFTIDVGEHSYRNIWSWFDYTIGLQRVVKLFSEVGYVIVDDVDNPIFQEQFIGLRFRVNIGRRIKDKFILNEILELFPPSEKPDYDVTKPRTDEHFFDNSKKRKLPIL